MGSLMDGLRPTGRHPAIAEYERERCDNIMAEALRLTRTARAASEHVARLDGRKPAGSPMVERRSLLIDKP